jgi:hypothetical protein
LAQLLYVGRVRPAAFVNQRLMGLNPINGADVDLAHALLNCTIGLLMIEAIGFGRGLGALDLNKDRIEARLHMLDPARLDVNQRNAIVAAFEVMKARAIMDISDDLEQPDRIALDNLIIASFRLGIDRNRIYDTLRTLVEVRQAIEV